MLPFLTADIRSCAGTFKQAPEDFEVEEVPAYLPQGEGEHLFLWVEKRGRTTPDVGRQLARALEVTERDVSWAGLKDRQAVTRQFFCVFTRKDPTPESFNINGVSVLSVARHRNKLKSGHLKGNVFTLRIRGVTDFEAAEQTVAQLKLRGVPNYFGTQRFGVAGDNAERGKKILLAGGRHRDRFERKMLLSAFQSALFNEVLAARVSNGQFSKVLTGDVLKKHETNGEFVCESAEVDQPRADSFEVSATGPMFGPEMRAPLGEVAVAEAAVLEAAGVTPDTFKAGGDETRGTRRFLRMALSDLTFTRVENDALLKFSLPAGSYATGVLRELLKRDSAESPDAAER